MEPSLAFLDTWLCSNNGSSIICLCYITMLILLDGYVITCMMLHLLMRIMNVTICVFKV